MKNQMFNFLTASLVFCFLLLGCQKDNVFNEQPTPNSLPKYQNSLPLDGQFLNAIQESETVQLFAQNFFSKNLRYAFELGQELIAVNMPEEAIGGRHAVVPVLDPQEKLAYLLFYTYNPETGVEGADLTEVFVNEEGQSVMRFYTDTNLQAGFDLVADASGNGIQGTAFGLDSPYIRCVLTRLVVMGAMNQVTLNFCMTQCLAGGVYNPACLTCIGGAAVLITAAWWSC